MKARADLLRPSPTRTREVTLRIAPWVQKPFAIVFADLSEFVSFTESAGDRVAAELVALNMVAATTITSARGGRVVKHLGDGLLACFSDPVQAVLASIELADAISGVLDVRVGAHWGDAIWTGNDLIGHSVNLGARLLDLAQPGEVLVTTQLCQAAGEVAGVTYGMATERNAKGVSHRLCVLTASRREET
jgi:class 3 adenylate cyclase